MNTVNWWNAVHVRVYANFFHGIRIYVRRFSTLVLGRGWSGDGINIDGDGRGWKWKWMGMGGDGNKVCGDGWGWVWCLSPCRSLIHPTRLEPGTKTVFIHESWSSIVIIIIRRWLLRWSSLLLMWPKVTRLYLLRLYVLVCVFLSVFHL